jgi:L-lactate utilization protein LutB
MEDKLMRARAALEEHGIRTQVVDTLEEAKALILERVQPGQRIGIGGSQTIEQLGVVPELESRGCQILWHWRGRSPEEVLALRRAQLTADVFLASSNAVTEDGRLVNVDGVGNRVGAMVFGPPKVILVCGQNKVVPDLAAALDRVHNVAAPQNGRRLKTGTPCAVAGRCTDCDSPGRMCSVTVIIERRPQKTDLEVILVRKELGY